MPRGGRKRDNRPAPASSVAIVNLSEAIPLENSPNTRKPNSSSSASMGSPKWRQPKRTHATTRNAGAIPSLKSGALFQRTRLCRFHDRGICSRGDACMFAHGSEFLRDQPDLWCTKMCPAILADAKCNNDACKFAHSQADLRQYTPQAGKLQPQDRIPLPFNIAAPTSFHPVLVPAMPACGIAKPGLNGSALSDNAIVTTDSSSTRTRRPQGEMPIRAGNLEDYFGAQRFDDHPYSSRQTKTGKKGGMDKVKFQSTPLARTQSMPQDSKDVKVALDIGNVEQQLKAAGKQPLALCVPKPHAPPTPPRSPRGGCSPRQEIMVDTSLCKEAMQNLNKTMEQSSKMYAQLDDVTEAVDCLDRSVQDLVLSVRQIQAKLDRQQLRHTQDQADVAKAQLPAPLRRRPAPTLLTSSAPHEISGTKNGSPTASFKCCRKA